MASSVNDTSNISALFSEIDLLYDARKNWMKNNWTFSIYFSVVYVILIFSGKAFMNSRPRLQLTAPLFAWNISLATFSICGAATLLWELYLLCMNHGFTYSVCDRRPIAYNRDVIFWMHFFCLSKVPELADTAFIILRKQPLIFLHWYHHITVLVYTWFSYSELAAPGLWFGAVNSAVHACMYTYYALKTLKIHVPRSIGIFITSFQMFQMVIGCAVNFTAYKALSQDQPCHVSKDNIKFSFLMYLSYLLLFAHFFYEAYIVGKSPTHKLVANGVKANGVHANGFHTNGIHVNGTKSNGVKSNGVKANGVKESNGFKSNGLASNGTKANGVNGVNGVKKIQ